MKYLNFNGFLKFKFFQIFQILTDFLITVIMDHDLKLKYFTRLFKYSLYRRAKSLKLKVVELYYKRKILEKYLKIWKLRATKTREIQRVCNCLVKKQNLSTLNDILDISSLDASLSKCIFAISHTRRKLMQKYFNEFKKFISLTKKCKNKV